MRGGLTVAAVASAVALAIGAVALAATSVDFDRRRPSSDVAESGAVRVAQAIPPECIELKAQEPEDPKEKLKWLKELIDCVKHRDLTPPVLEISAPDVVGPEQESYVLTGYIGDESSTPSLMLNGETLDLADAGPDAPDLGKHTYEFSYRVGVGEEGEHHFVFEAQDQAGNRIAEEIVVAVVSTTQPYFDGAYHALIIANSDYQNLPDVPTAITDGKAFADLINHRYEFDEENIILLIDATRRDILATLSELRGSLAPDDRLLIYYTGRGHYDAEVGVGFWQPVDADEIDDFTWVAIDEINRNLKGMAEASAKHVLVIADSVYPIERLRGVRLRKRDPYFDTIDSFVSRKMIAAGEPVPMSNQASGNHSVFTYALLKVLRDNQEPYITSKQLHDQLSHELSVISDIKPEWGVIPETGDEGSGEFTFILRSSPVAATQ